VSNSDLRAPTRAGYGMEISSVRLDELDLCFLLRIKQWGRSGQRPHMLEIGCGSGALAREAARTGAAVTAIDAVQVPTHPDDAANGIRFFTASAPVFHEALDESRFDFLVSQRTLHYLTQQECAATLQWFRRHVRVMAWTFLGVSGLSSELSDGYADSDTPVAHRWGPLSAAMAAKHHIHRNVCLYSSNELTQLVADCGFQVEDCWLSPFGNIKLIARTI